MKKLRYLALALPLAGSVYLLLDRDSAPARAEATVARPDMLIAPGRVEPVHDVVRLAFEAQGRISTLLVEEGDSVTAGQPLARLDDRLARARVAAAQAGVAQAEARLALARRGPRGEDVTAARAEAEAANAAADHRAAEQQRSARLGDAGAVANATVEADGAAARVARAQASAATARYQSLARGTRSEQIEEAAAALALARAELAGAEIALDQLTLRAPASGVVLRKTAEVGQLVTLVNPQPIYSLADLSALEVRVEIDEADLAAAIVGKRGYATAEAYGDKRFAVVIDRVTRELGRKTVRDDDPRARFDTRVLEVIARLEDEPSSGPTRLPLGLRMQVHVARSSPAH